MFQMPSADICRRLYRRCGADELRVRWWLHARVSSRLRCLRPRHIQARWQRSVPAVSCWQLLSTAGVDKLFRLSGERGVRYRKCNVPVQSGIHAAAVGLRGVRARDLQAKCLQRPLSDLPAPCHDCKWQHLSSKLLMPRGIQRTECWSRLPALRDRLRKVFAWRRPMRAMSSWNIHTAGHWGVSVRRMRPRDLQQHFWAVLQQH